MVEAEKFFADSKLYTILIYFCFAVFGKRFSRIE